METIYILDAVNYLFRSYYAIGPMTNPDGNSTSGLYGFIRSLQKVLDTFSPTHIVAVFDGPDNSKKRQEIYSEYKMHRKKAPEDLYPQIDWAYAFCKKAGIPALCVPEVEADDAIASIALWAKNKGIHSRICTSDKDLFQIICEEIQVINIHKNGLLIDEKKVEEIYGVRPDQMLDLLAIMGDTADNIPGLSGFGPKTAALLLQQFGSLDAILQHPEKVAGKKKQETLIREKKEALFSRELARLDLEVAVPKKEEFYAIDTPDIPALKAFYHQMHFMTLYKELDGAEKEEPFHYTIIRTETELLDWLKKVEDQKVIGVDTETTSLSVLDARLVGIGFSAEEKTAVYIPFNGSISQEVLEKHLQPFFAKTDRFFTAHNAKYDHHVLLNHGLFIENIGFDTMIASYLLHPEKRRHNLDALCLEEFHKKKTPLSSLLKKKTDKLEDVPIEEVGNYCCEDVDYTMRLQDRFSSRIEQEKLQDVFHTIELPLIKILAKMERNGMFLDTQRLETQRKDLQEKLEKIKKSIYEEAGETFNLNSPKQLSVILFEKLNLPKPPRAKTSTATGAKILEALAKDHPFVEKILRFRSLDKLVSTYALALPKAVHPKTGRIHCSFNQSVVSTGRLSSNDPNLQNIPIRSEEGRKIREAFRPEKPGWVFLSADYSQIELRLLAHFSKDPELIHAFQQGEDIHSYTASLVYNVPLDKVTKDMRYAAKAVNFGILYGQSAYGLAEELKISRKDAKQFIDTYFARYTSIASYIQESIELAKEKGFSSTITGRKRPLVELHNKNPILQKAAERLAVNTPLQGSAADLIKCAMIAIDKEIKNLQAMMVLQVHDELIFELPEEELNELKPLVKRAMEEVWSLNVPLVIDISVGNNWGEC